MSILAVSISTARHLGEIGFIIGAVGALLLAVESARPDSQSGRNMIRLIGSLLIAIGFVLAIFYVHTV